MQSEIGQELCRYKKGCKAKSRGCDKLHLDACLKPNCDCERIHSTKEFVRINDVNTITAWKCTIKEISIMGEGANETRTETPVEIRFHTISETRYPISETELKAKIEADKDAVIVKSTDENETKEELKSNSTINATQNTEHKSKLPRKEKKDTKKNASNFAWADMIDDIDEFQKAANTIQQPKRQTVYASELEKDYKKHNRDNAKHPISGVDKEKFVKKPERVERSSVLGPYVPSYTESKFESQYDPRYEHTRQTYPRMTQQSHNNSLPNQYTHERIRKPYKDYKEEKIQLVIGKYFTGKATDIELMSVIELLTKRKEENEKLVAEDTKNNRKVTRSIIG